jgi:hypothetical protein
MTDRQVLRRRVLRAAFASVAAWFAPGAMSRAGVVRAKRCRKKKRNTRTVRKTSACVRLCTLFEPPKSCKVVEGEISPNGWCKAFGLAD